MKKNKRTQMMSGILILVFAVVFFGVAGRFLYIQASGTVNGVSLSKWAKEKRTSTYTLDAERGKILDRNSETLAYDHPTFTLYATVDEKYTVDEEEPEHVVDSQKTAEQLAPILDLDVSYIQERIKWGKENDQTQVEFGSSGKELSQQTKEEIEELNLPGIGFTKQAIRNYPNGKFASRVIGFAQKNDQDTITGVTGIEKQMDGRLKGEDGRISYERDRYGTKLLNPNEVVQKPENGQNIHLTIDQKIQTALDDIMTQADEAYNPSRMTAIVMNPETGEIMAMSNRPSYNPNDPGNIENWYNDAISTPIEPGSTIKMITWASAIESGNYNGEETFKSGTYQVNDLVNPVHDHNNGEGWGTISFDEGFRRSSNVAASKLLWEKMGPDVFQDYLHKFDLNQKTGIDLPGETSGEFVYRWPYEQLTASFGQGNTYTPMQIMKAASAIANDGKMMKPYVTSEIVDPSTGETVKDNKPEQVGQPISNETADHVMNLLGNVVSSEDGTGQPYRLDDYSVAGKTGTAQIADPDRPGHLRGRNNHIYSFLGMAPKDDPSLMMYVMVKQPELKPSEIGSSPVSFVFNNVMETGLHYMDIDPDKDADPAVKSVTMPDITGKSVSQMQQFVNENDLDAVFIGDGKTVTSVNMKQGEEIIGSQRIVFVTDQPKMPDMSGWSKRNVLQVADMLDLETDLKGRGYLQSQSMPAGEPIKENSSLKAAFDTPENTAETEAEKNNNDDDGNT